MTATLTDVESFFYVTPVTKDTTMNVSTGSARRRSARGCSMRMLYGDAFRA